MSEEQLKSALQDAHGDISSKRVWAFRFGNMTLIQLSVASIVFMVFPILGITVTEILAETFKYGIGATMVGTLVCLGFTIPEWFKK